MHLHLNCTQEPAFWRPRYALSARLHVTDDELAIIQRHQLDRSLVFVDPARQQFDVAAAQARARSPGLSILSPGKAGRAFLAEWRALSATREAARAFCVSLADLLVGIKIEHPQLAEILVIERALSAKVDDIAEAIDNAARYELGFDDEIAPRGSGPALPRPSTWLPRRRHG